jgi:hypothetical protein
MHLESFNKVIMLNQYKFSIFLTSVFLLTSCKAQKKNSASEQSEMQRNVEQLQKRVEKDEKKMDVTEYEIMRPK